MSLGTAFLKRQLVKNLILFFEDHFSGNNFIVGIDF